jgi:hypothetical protein
MGKMHGVGQPTKKVISRRRMIVVIAVANRREQIPLLQSGTEEDVTQDRI